MKTLAIIALAGATSLAALPAYAQTATTEAQPQPRVERIDREALLDARIAGIRAGLRLTSEQEELFAPVEEAIRDMAQQRMARWEEMRERRQEMRGDRRGEMRGAMRDMSPEERREARAERRAQRQAARQDAPDFMNRLENRAERAAEHAEQMGALASAMGPLWESLDEDQRRLVPVLMRDTMGARGGHRMAAHHHGGRYGHRHGGYGEGRSWR